MTRSDGLKRETSSGQKSLQTKLVGLFLDVMTAAGGDQRKLWLGTHMPRVTVHIVQDYV